MTPSRILAIVALTIVGVAVLFTGVRSMSSEDATTATAAAPAEAANPSASEADATETGSPVASTSAIPTTPTTTAPAAASPDPADAPPVLGPARTLVELDGWLNSDVTSLEEFDASVRIVQFWTFGCINCKRTLESLRGLYDDYGDAGLEVIGVHSPEFEREKDPAAIAAAAEDLGVNWPIALDTEKRNFRSWQGSRRFWPRTYVLDADNNIRFDHIGEGSYDELRATVEWLLASEA